MSLLGKIRDVEWKGFNQLVHNLEEKYGDSGQRDDVVNLTNLKRYRVTKTVNNMALSATGMSTRRSARSSSTALQLPTAHRHHSYPSASSSSAPASILSTKDLLVPRWVPPPTSLVYDVQTQMNALQNLYMLLTKGDMQSKVVKNKLIKRAMKTLNLTNLPPADIVQPFFEFDDEKEINVSFLFQAAGSSWSARNEAYYGSSYANMLNLQKQIYAVLLAPETRGLMRESMLTNTQEFTSSTPRKSLRIMNRSSPRDSAFEDVYYEEPSEDEEEEMLEEEEEEEEEPLEEESILMPSAIKMTKHKAPVATKRSRTASTTLPAAPTITGRRKSVPTKRAQESQSMSTRGRGRKAQSARK